MSDDRLDRLEKRLSVIEGLVRQLMPLLKERAPSLEQIVEEREAEKAETAMSAASARSEQVPATLSNPADIAVPAASAPPRRPSAPLPPSVDSEQWFGQRGLLGVGVVFLILAVGYLLKLSFERGWISPAARCTGGALAGIIIGAVGWRLVKKVRTYGAALIGCGAAIVYLSVWAATRLYEFLPPTTGIAALAIVSLSLAAIAFAIDVEALGATAALGAFFAPLLLESDPARADALLLYLGFIGAALGWVAGRRQWRLAMLVVGASFFGLVTTGAAEYANPYWVLAYGLLGGCGGLYIGLREGWVETRILAFSGGWGLISLANDQFVEHWPTVLGAVVMAAPPWWRALRSSTIWPGNGRLVPPSGWAAGEAFYFYVTPVLVAWAVYQLDPAGFDLNQGLLPLIIAVPYLLTGFSAERRPFALVGTTALLVAAMLQWRGIEAAWALLLLALLWAGACHLLRRSDCRWYGLIALGVGLAHLLTTAQTQRPGVEPAFIGTWAVTLWWAAATFAAYARGLWRRFEGDDELAGKTIPSALWVTFGLLLLFGITRELTRFFAQSTLRSDTASLASGLAVSAWWIIYAATLVLLGFRRGWKPVRVAGLLVAGMAVTKVVFFDLSTLDALYRVGSVLILGLVSLGLAYLYNKKAAGEGG